MSHEQNLWGEDEIARDLKFYLATAKKLFFWVMVLILFIYLLSLISFLQWSRESLNYISWLIIVLLLLAVCYRVARVKSEELTHAAITGSLIGWAISFWHVILDAIWFWSPWRILDIILEPIAAAVVGFLIGLLVAAVYRLKRNRYSSPEIDKAEDQQENKEFDPTLPLEQDEIWPPEVELFQNNDGQPEAPTEILEEKRPEITKAEILITEDKQEEIPIVIKEIIEVKPLPVKKPKPKLPVKKKKPPVAAPEAAPLPEPEVKEAKIRKAKNKKINNKNQK